jgi:hypothetical protein
MIGDGNAIAIGQLQIGLVPFKDVASTLVFGKKSLGTEESDLESREEVPLTFNDGHVTGIVENLVPETTPFTGN